MILKTKKYPIMFTGEESDTFVEAPEDVFYLNHKNQKYKQFHKGQLIPKEILDELYPKKVKEVVVDDSKDIVNKIEDTVVDDVVLQKTTPSPKTNSVKKYKGKK